jgi:uncharacterized protein (TIGR02996 family)
MTPEALLAAVADAPDDDAPRLVFADWLDDHGQHDRAELIRVQVALARLPADDDRRPALLARERGLLLANENFWAGPAARVARSYAFRRGFLEEATLADDFDADQAEELLRCPTLRRLRVEGQRRGRRRWPSLSGLEALDLSGQPLEAAAVAALVEAVGPGRLKELRLAGCRFLDLDAARGLVGSPLPAGLDVLDLSETGLFHDCLRDLLAGLPSPGPFVLDLDGCDVRDEGVAALAGASGLCRLERLGLGWCGISNEAVGVLAGAERLATLRRLRLAANGLDEAGALDALLRAPHLAGLSDLDLSVGQLPWDDDAPTDGDALRPSRLPATAAPGLRLRLAQSPAVEVLTEAAPHLGRVTRLDLCGCWIDADAFAALFGPRGDRLPRLVHLDLSHANVQRWHDDAPFLEALRAPRLRPLARRLTLLSLAATGLGPHGAYAVARAPLSNLRALDLSGNDCGDDAARALAASGLPLTALDLSRTGLTDDGVAALARSRLCRGLRVLRLAGNRLGDRAAAALAASPHLGGLHVLDLSHNDVGPDGARALARSERLSNPAVLDVGHNRRLDEGGRPALLRAALRHMGREAQT